LSKATGSEVMNGGNQSVAGALIYTYMIAIGDYDTGSFNDDPNSVLVWGSFLVCTLIVQIVMLNLLISIISDTYAKVQ